MASLSFAARLRARHAAEWRALLDHAFLRGLASGELPLACFSFHQRQDLLYLEILAEALALGLERARVDPAASVLRELRAGALAEQTEIEARAPGLGLSRSALRETDPAAVTLVYGAALRQAARRASGELLAALLPCVLLYPAVAERHAGAAPGPLYRAWLESCGAEEFRRLAARCGEALDAIAAGVSAAERERYGHAYATSLRFEGLFLTVALERRAGPIGADGTEP